MISTKTDLHDIVFSNISTFCLQVKMVRNLLVKRFMDTSLTIYHFLNHFFLVQRRNIVLNEKRFFKAMVNFYLMIDYMTSIRN